MKPMNACPLKPEKYDQVIGNPDYIVEEKLKGIRATVEFTKTSNIIVSRGGHDISHRFPHIRDEVYPELAGLILDGELFQRGIEDEVISGWGNHNTKNIDPSVTKEVMLYFFDILARPNHHYDPDNEELTLIEPALLPLKERKQILSGFGFEYISYTNFIELAWIYQVSKATATNYYDIIIAKGGEGIMLKNINSLYHLGKRPANTWYKMKKTQTFDVIITGFEPAKMYSIKKGSTIESQTKFAGMIGAFEYGMYVDNFTGGKGKQLKALGTCSGMSDAVRELMTNYPSMFIGKVVEIEGVEQKESGAIDNPRFKRLREDKKPEECVWERKLR